MNKIYFSSVLVALIATTGLTNALPCFAKHDKAQEPAAVNGCTFPIVHKDGVHEEILIKASPKVVWQSMQEQRKLDPDSQYCKATTENARPVVEQKFVFPSPFGDAECILHLSEIFNERVDFRLTESEDLKKMEGCWTLTPENNGQSTKLELSSYVEPHMMIPRILTNGVISHKVKRNLAMVKKIAEKNPDKSM